MVYPEGDPGSRTISLKRAARLRQKKHREAERLFLAEGETLIRESPEPPRQTFEAPEDIRRISTLTTPAVSVGVFPFLDVTGERVLESRERVVLLHGVQDPGNVGTIIRAAHAFDAGVALSSGCADLYNPKTVRATMGSFFHTPVAREVGTLELLEASAGSGFTSVATVPRGKQSPRDLPDEKLVLVVGPEGKGLPAEIVEACDRVATIPSRAASLNAAMAASILLYQAYMRVLP